jgi:hypothetical protein
MDVEILLCRKARFRCKRGTAHRLLSSDCNPPRNSITKKSSRYGYEAHTRSLMNKATLCSPTGSLSPRTTTKSRLRTQHVWETATGASSTYLWLSSIITTIVYERTVPVEISGICTAVDSNHSNLVCLTTYDKYKEASILFLINNL